jgi:hypothetical protein
MYAGVLKQNETNEEIHEDIHVQKKCVHDERVFVLYDHLQDVGRGFGDCSGETGCCCWKYVELSGDPGAPGG